MGGRPKCVMHAGNLQLLHLNTSRVPLASGLLFGGAPIGGSSAAATVKSLMKALKEQFLQLGMAESRSLTLLCTTPQGSRIAG